MPWGDYLAMLALGAACAFLVGLAVCALEALQRRRQPRGDGGFNVRK